MKPKVGDVMYGTVAEFQPNGALIALPDGEMGFLHVSEIADEPQVRAEGHLALGQEVLVKVIGYDRLGRPSLSLRRLSDQDREAAEFHRQAQEMRKACLVRSMAVAPKVQPGTRIEWELSRWIEEAKRALVRLRRRRDKRISERLRME